MKLYICGNGFDLHHGYKTGYNGYRNFLIEHYSHAFRAFEDFQYLDLSSTEKWSDLEQSLTINYDECIDNAISEYYPDVNDDSDSRWYGAFLMGQIVIPISYCYLPNNHKDHNFFLQAAFHHSLNLKIAYNDNNNGKKFHFPPPPLLRVGSSRR